MMHLDSHECNDKLLYNNRPEKKGHNNYYFTDIFLSF